MKWLWWVVLVYGFAQIGYGVFLWLRSNRTHVVGFEKLQGEQAVVTLSDGRKFRGSCTVWHSYPSGKRAPTDIEGICCDEWTRQMWGTDAKK